MKEQNVNSVGEISRRDLFKAAALGAGAYMLGAQLGSSPAHAAVKEDKW